MQVPGLQIVFVFSFLDSLQVYAIIANDYNFLAKSDVNIETRDKKQKRMR